MFVSVFVVGLYYLIFNSETNIIFELWTNFNLPEF